MDESKDQIPDAIGREVDRARIAGAWVPPSEELVQRVLALPGVSGTSVAPVGSGAQELEWDTRDVRSVTGLERRVVSRIFGEGEIGLTAEPKEGESYWSFRGKVWLRDSSSGRIRITLGCEDHVLATVETRSGDTFELEEVVAPGWELEFLLPSGRSMTVGDRDS